SRQQKDAEESGKAPPTEPVYESCWETPELAKALIAVGRGDKELAATLAALLDGPAPPEAQPYVAWALSEASGNPALLVDGLIRILDAPDPKAYSWGRVMDLLAEVDPTQSERLRPYHARLAAMAESGNGGFGYFMLTGDVGPLEKQCRDDIDRSTRRHSISHVLTYSIFHYGAVAAPLAAKMIRLMETGTAHEKHDVAAALVAVGPTPETRGTAASLRALVEGFKPQSRVAPAMALWSCCGRSDEAVDILVPLLEDHGWATTHASWALGQMGRDARSALPRLRNLARSRNAAYAKWASEAVALIEAELSRKVTPRAVYEELGAANYLVSIRALRHFKDMGRSAAPAVRGCLEREATDRLPGALARQQARARQVLALLAGE
ncbi:MAG TPA: hypothetical protein PLP01_14170, partial [Phycisphaerae bacterium]|nr:hypothetical protein [Phycisphaerae bacterium]